ncbi:MAG: hypothetical protein M3083_14460 [Actinomycetota bacterium]|nr:hypothetical protein [Actinomycetota bacterium]
MLVVTSELVTNGVLHDGGDLITLRADRLDHAVVIEVMADDTTTIASMRVMYVWIHERGQPRLGGVHHRGGVRRPLGKMGLLTLPWVGLEFQGYLVGHWSAG